jgi:NADPH-dependent glutamate synthase beta subunit-like oxidoreductase
VAEPGAACPGLQAVVVATGLAVPSRLGVPGEELASGALSLLAAPERQRLAGRRVAVVGGGAVAADCAETAVRAGAVHVELLALEKLPELPLTGAEREGLLRAGVEVSGPG